MGRRRRRKRRLEDRATGRNARPKRVVEVRVERSPKGRRRKKSAKVTKRSRRNGRVSEESYEL